MNGKASCNYCDRSNGELTEEHIIPRAIGGTATISPVCKICNGGVLSVLDKNLCSQSPLAFHASFHMPKKRLLHTWFLDLQCNRLMLEGLYNPVTKDLTLLPQLIFDSQSSNLRGNGEEMAKFGMDNIPKRFPKRFLTHFAQLQPF